MSGLSSLLGIPTQSVDDINARAQAGNPVGSDLSEIQAALNAEHTILSDGNTRATTSLINQNEISNIINTEKNRLDDKKTIVDQQLSSQERLLELNDSYRKRQSEYIYIIFVIIIGLFLYIILVQIGKYFTIIPEFIIQLLIVSISALVAIYVILLIININKRDRLNHDNIMLNPPPVKTPEELEKDKSAAKEKGNLLQASYNPNECSGKNCCSSGDMWNAYSNKCDISCGDNLILKDGICKPKTDCSGDNKACGKFCVPIATRCITESFSLNMNKVEPFQPSEFSQYAKI